MKINVSVFNEELSFTDKFAKALNKIYEGETDRLYSGVFSKPYNEYTGKLQENHDKEVLAYCDKMVDGEPQSYGWRWWGKRAEVLIEELKKEGIELKEI
jgi:hypothetical protein